MRFAEELGITSVMQMAQSDNPAISRLLGSPNNWALNIIAQSGIERHVGVNTP